jgi:catechol 2,3-dioxygenase-like lactoylglutathione lyase family enzyme
LFHHVGITISDKAEVENFYKNILGFELIKMFTISAFLSEKIFNIEKDIEVALIDNKDFTIELFISKIENKQNYEHICIMVENREQIIKKTQEKGYPCIMIEREPFDIVFVKDKSGNLFEIKEKE